MRPSLLRIIALLFPSAALAAPTVLAAQGGVARWAAPGARACMMAGKRHAPVAGACYFPVDVRARPGRRAIAWLDNEGARHLGVLDVRPGTFPEVAIELKPELSRYVDVATADEARAAEEAALVTRALQVDAESAPRFRLPLARPVARLPRSQDDFGSDRRFGAAPRPSLHTGRDYPVPVRTKIRAPAAGRVLLAADHFFTGQAVYVDHGGGLVTMYFHLGSIAVKTGDVVKKGQLLGAVGATGRATGPHLHVGVRWLGRRVDPDLLLGPPRALPSVGDSTAVAEAKLDAADAKEEPETDVVFEPDAD